MVVYAIAALHSVVYVVRRDGWKLIFIRNVNSCVEKKNNNNKKK